MKRKAEKADIVKRKVFHEHIILLTEGRFLMLAVLAVMAWLPYLFVRDRMAGMMLAWWEIPFLLLVEVSLYYALLRQFWYRCFGCLVVTEDEIVWKCPFYVDGAAEKGGDQIHRDRLPLVRKRRQGSNACRDGVFFHKVLSAGVPGQELSAAPQKGIY